MIKLIRTDSDNPDFAGLVSFLDEELEIRDGDDHLFYSQFNSISNIKYVVVARKDGRAIGCGAIKEYDKDTMEIKRMYISPESRKMGIASDILAELEKWASELSYAKCILETGRKQPEAIGLYKKNGYRIIPNYGQYCGVENSVCFEKELR
jgi:putative acetyltransferase